MTTKRESFLSAVLIHLHELDLADSHDLLRVLLPPNQAELYKSVFSSLFMFPLETNRNDEGTGVPRGE